VRQVLPGKRPWRAAAGISAVGHNRPWQPFLRNGNWDAFMPRRGTTNETSAQNIPEICRGRCNRARVFTGRWAQTYPTRPITMIVPGAAGGPGDAIARVLVERMRGSLGQSIVIENVSGAESSIGTGRAARARPDG
jgi:hypothetical protein